MKDLPETVIHAAVLHAAVELHLGLALERLPLIERRTIFASERREDFRPVGEQKSIAYIEKNHFQFLHCFILLEAMTDAGRVI